MSGFDGGKVDKAGLKKFYASDDVGRAVLDHFANRERNQNTTTVRRLKSNIAGEGTKTSRGQVIRAFKELESVGCGEFVAGRKGYESRFEWHVSSKSVGQVAAGETTEIESDVPPPEANEEGSDELIEHRFQLRPDLATTINLPADLTDREADRLATFIKALPFSQA